jgi:hypothetical protein
VPSAPEIARDVVSSQINPDSTFNFFAVDVSMSMTGLDSLYQPDLVRSVSYHVERTLDDGVWTTSAVPRSDTRWHAELAAGVRNLGHEYFPGRRGNHRQKRRCLPPIVRRDKIPDHADPRAWIRRYAIAPWQIQSAGATRHRRFGDPVGKVGNLQRYTTKLGGALFEALVDSASGAVVEENIAEDGQLRLHTIHRFTRLPNGILIHLSDHSEISGASSSAPRAVIETTFSNMRIETHGGAR